MRHSDTPICDCSSRLDRDTQRSNTGCFCLSTSSMADVLCKVLSVLYNHLLHLTLHNNQI